MSSTMKCPICDSITYEISNLKHFFILKMSCLLNVLSMKVFFIEFNVAMKRPIYAMSNLCNVISLKCSVYYDL